MLQKLTANVPSVFLYFVGAVFSCVVAYEMIVQQPLNTVAIALVYGVITAASNASGVKSGVDHTNDTVKKVAQVLPAAIATVSQPVAEEAKP